jgi:predicted regulator of Ras-like GTPase activity (Roadblock/LC7/MglB family)
MAKYEELQREVDNLRAAIPELKGVVVASTEGLPIAHSLSNGVDAARVAAMAAAAASLGKRVSETLNVGSLSEISVSGAEGQIFLYAAGTKGVLAVIGPNGANAGLIHLESRSAAVSIGQRF